VTSTVTLSLLFRPNRTISYRRGCFIRPYAACRIFGSQVAVKCTTKIGDSTLKRYTGKAGANGKSGIPNACNAAPYYYAGKACTTEKSLLPNAGNAASYGNAGKAFKTEKSLLPNAGNIVEIALNNSC